MVSVLFAFAPVFSMLYWIMLLCFGNDIYETTFGGILHNIAFHHGVGATSMLLAMCNSITLYDKEDQCLFCHLKCGEGLNTGVCIKNCRFVQASTVFVNLNLVSKVKGGLFGKCTFDL